MPLPPPPVPRQGRREAAILLHAVARDAPLDPDEVRDLVARASAASVLGMSAHHRLEGLAHERLGHLLTPGDPVREELAARYRRAVDRHLAALFELAGLAPVLDATGVRWAVIKGPVLVEQLYGLPGRRSYGDLDLLVDPRGFREVLAALDRHGARLLDRNWAAIRHDLRGEVHLTLPRRTPCDLHWNLLNMFRGRMWIDTGKILARAVPVRLGGIAVATLDPADTLIHLAVHAAVSGGDRMIWLLDIARSIAVRPPDWEAVTQRARAWRVERPVGHILGRAQAAVGAEVPFGVVRALSGAWVPGAARLIDRISPWETALGRFTTPSIVFTRGLGHGLPGGLGWLVSRGIRALDPREPEASSAFTPAGDERDRDAYLDAVAAVGRKADATRPANPSSRPAA